MTSLDYQSGASPVGVSGRVKYTCLTSRRPNYSAGDRSAESRRSWTPCYF
ncbi:hypothetical protein [Argonema antarcticum]|nr:hypothetical protein [Argonema antarcticum]MCL1472837.1 hypothetical protein [Argonema antarcticum A004/B2]